MKEKLSRKEEILRNFRQENMRKICGSTVYTADELFIAWCSYKQHCDENPIYKNDVLKQGERAGEIVKIPLQRAYTIIGFCNYIGMTKTWFYDSLADNKDNGASKLVKDIIEQESEGHLLEHGLVDSFNASIVSKLLGLVERKEIKNSSQEEEEYIKKILNEQKRRT